MAEPSPDPYAFLAERQPPVWELASTSSELQMDLYLEDGWEPFAVYDSSGPRSLYGPTVYFRRLRRQDDASAV